MKFIKRAGIAVIAGIVTMMMLLPSAEIAFAAPTSGSQSGSSSTSSSSQSKGTTTSGSSTSGSTSQKSGGSSSSSGTSGSSGSSSSSSGSGSTSGSTNTYSQGNSSTSGSTSTYGTNSSTTSGTTSTTTDSTSTTGTSTSSSGSAKHQTNKASYSLDSLSDYYYDSNQKAQKRNKDAIAISFTGGDAASIAYMSRIATLYTNEQKAYPVSFLMDTGDASSAAPLSAIFSSQAPIWRIMGSAGYDAAGIGQGEFSFGASSLASALNSAVSSSEIVPYLSCSNVTVSGSLKKAYSNFGIEKYTVITRYGKKVAIFSVISKSAFEKAGIKGVKYSDYVQAAKDEVKTIQKKEKPDLIVCLANTTDRGSLTESSRLASVSGLDLVLTGGGKGNVSKGSSDEATVVQSTDASSLNTVVFKTSGSSYKYSKVVMSKLSKESATATVTSQVEKFEKLSDSAYFSKYGLSYAKTVTSNTIDFGSTSDLLSSRTDLGFTNLLTDAYLYAARNIAGVNRTNIVSIMSPAAVSSVFAKGTLTSGDVYADLGKGSSAGTSGQSLKYFFLTGKELQNVAELTSTEYKQDASKRLYFGGLTYIYNPHRVLSNKVYQFRLIDQNGKATKVDSSKKYLVVADEQAASVLKTIASGHGQSLSVTMKGHSGEALKEAPYLKHNGSVIKVWGAAARYLKSMGSTIPSKYSKSGVRMVYDGSILPSHIFKETNGVAGVMIAIAVIIIAVVLLLIILIVHIFRGGRGGRGGFGGGGGFGGKRRHDKDIFGNGRRRNRFPRRKKKERSIFTNK